MKNAPTLPVICLLLLAVACYCPDPPPRATSTPTPELQTFTEVRREAQALIDFQSGEFTKKDVERFERLLFQINAISQSDLDHKEAQRLKVQVERKLAGIRTEIATLGPRPNEIEMNVAFNKHLRGQLNDYDSSEYITHSPPIREYVRNEPFWTTTLRLRAKNRFGAFVVKDIKFYIQHKRVVRAIEL